MRGCNAARQNIDMALQRGTPLHPTAKEAKMSESTKSWRDLPKTKLALFLYDHVQITDKSWTTEDRLPGESRDDFIKRVLGKKRPS